jgi:hypothetical protein
MTPLGSVDLVVHSVALMMFLFEASCVL